MKPLDRDEARRIGRYRALALLGEGGMGRVLLAAGPDGRLVAVKQVHPGFAHDNGFRSRFRREVETSRMVSGAYTAAVMDADPNAPTPWLASVYVAGPSLQEAVDRAGRLPPGSVRHLAAGLASALSEIHRVGLVHRDLKPSNVILTGDGPRVIDFGIARAAQGGTELTHTGSIIGSPAFMSPEQAEGKQVTAASDVFSLGALLVMASSGQAPFSGASTPQTLYNVVHAQPDLRFLPPEVRRIAEPCLAKDPARRPTPAQLLQLIGPLVPVPQPWPASVHALVGEHEQAARRALKSPPRKRALGIALAAAGAAAVLAAGTIIAVNSTGTEAAAPSSSASAAPPAAATPVSTDPLGPPKVRGIAPCPILDGQQAPGLGKLKALKTLSFLDCLYQAGDQQISLRIGGAKRTEATQLGDIGGVPVLVDRTGTICYAAVPLTGAPELTVEVNLDRTGESTCDVAKALVGTAVTRIRAATPATTGLSTVDPCELVDRTVAQGILGPIGGVRAEDLHTCVWEVAGSVKVSLQRYYPPKKSTDPSAAEVDLGGVKAFSVTSRNNPASADCTLTWAHKPLSEEESENVEVQFRTMSNPLPDAEICRQAQEFAKALLPKLPKA
ncbi:serine/threonine-protein kinase [Amycolatopsis sp. CA-230715]|uniref:serine/threonine-protein kinase n=1 Tax=Amycolatopsis sp. CA-230715 TaxID=2745196 RepID=UPI001C028FD1|nr:serine/threonine-protein kinase [Amycolatopsis sp. CA-230715]QWF80825.1 Serine/threonine-protein kinase PknD [Amycolatopsis sp. CA-230715]